MIVLAQSAPAAPFFTNDLPGFLKILGVYGASVAVILAALVKFTFNAHTDRVKKIEGDVDGLGKRLDNESQSQTRCTEAVSQLTQRVAVQEQAATTFAEKMGEHSALIAAFQRTQNEQQRDIMQAISESGRAIASEQRAGIAELTEKINNLKIEVARLDEREKIGDAIAGLAQTLRETRNN